MYELSMAPEDVWDLLPLVQATLNSRGSVQRLKGLTPNEVHLGRKLARPLDTVSGRLLPAAAAHDNDVVARAMANVEEHVAALSTALTENWAVAAEGRAEVHAANAQRRDQSAQPVSFEIGDYVVMYTALRRHKLRVKWLGPYRVVATVNDWVYVLEDLTSGACQNVHAARLRPYADKTLHVTQDMRDTSTYDAVFYVESFAGFRVNDDDELELKVHWLGFEPMEFSWESIAKMHASSPKLLARYLRSIYFDCDHVHELLVRLGIDIPQRRTRAPPARGGRRGRGRGAVAGRDRGATTARARGRGQGVAAGATDGAASNAAGNRGRASARTRGQRSRRRGRPRN